MDNNTRNLMRRKFFQSPGFPESTKWEIVARKCSKHHLHFLAHSGEDYVVFVFNRPIVDRAVPEDKFTCGKKSGASLFYGMLKRDGVS